MRLPISKGDLIRVTAQGHSIIGSVTVVANRPLEDGTTDSWNYWDIEYDILNPLAGHGSYGRWKQSCDGGEVSLLDQGCWHVVWWYGRQHGHMSSEHRAAIRRYGNAAVYTTGRL